jgi:hypothetical protein
MLCQVSSGFDPIDKVAHADAQPRRHPQHRRKRRHPVAPLQVRHERRTQLCRLGQTLLGHPPLQPELPHPSTERWHDANLSIQLTPLPMGSGTSKRRPTSSGSPDLFSVTVRWEYTTIPGHQQRRFICTADRDEYDELANSNDGTTGWYVGPSSNVDAATANAFELLAFTVDGDQRPIRRSARKHGQTYSVAVGDGATRAAEPVTISYTYRTTIASNANMLFFSIEQPTRNLNLQFDYSGCGIASVSTPDLVPSIRPTRIERAPAKTHTDTIRVDLDGWIFPRSGVAFVWTLAEDPAVRSDLRGWNRTTSAH